MKYELDYTTDYAKFKKLSGNRSVDRKRIERVKNSIQLTGLKCVPILVNEKYEVCEGQARLSAYKELGLPVPFIMQEGLTIEDAISLNVSSTKWTTLDYVNSYAQQGNVEYKFLVKLFDKYPSIPPVAIVKLVGTYTDDTHVSEVVRNGDFRIRIGDMISAENKVAWVASLMPVFAHLSGRKQGWITATGFCYDHPSIENDRLKEKLEEYGNTLTPVVDVNGAIAQIEDVYNYHARGRRLFISHLFAEYMDARARGRVC